MAAKYRVVKETLATPRKVETGKDQDGNPIMTQPAGGPVIWKVGDEVEFEGQPGSNLRPLNAEAEKATKEAEEKVTEERRQAELKKTPGLAELVAALITKIDTPKAAAAHDNGGEVSERRGPGRPRSSAT